MILRLTLFFVLCLFSCAYEKDSVSETESTFTIRNISESCFVHTSYLQVENYGPFPCNGMVVMNGNEAVILDTPVDSVSAVKLFSFVEDSLNAKIKAVVVNHFHNDCLGSLNVFHNNGIQSYANSKTIELAKNDGVEVPVNGFDSILFLTIGGEVLVNQYFGEGHTPDNIISYWGKDKVLFGGCLVKELGSGKGNLNDANTKQWSNTVESVQSVYKEVEIVVPGHGKIGGIELLGYTARLFRDEY